MPSSHRSDGRDQASRALRAVERHAGAVARSVYDRWRARSGPPQPRVPADAPRVPTSAARPMPAPAGRSGDGEIGPADLSETEVGDLRVELERELERLAGADISASRGAGTLADERSPGPGRE